MEAGGSSLTFEWDDAKAASNAAKHGVRFEVAANIFLDPGLADFDASRVGDGEERRKAVGMIQGRLFTIVYVLRGSVRRLISARPSNAAEKRRHADR
jgi:uncharacterized DUF497 family protein